MKIGILTHHFIANFGAFLQAYALQECLKREFPNDEVYVINYIHLKHCIVNNGGWFRYYWGRENFSAWWQKIHLPFTFYKARKTYLNMTKRCYDANDVNELGLDVIVVGSDEVWNYSDSKSDAKIKFGDGLTCKKIISYAPSVGNSEYNENTPDYVKEGIKKFKAISVRDSLGCDLVEKIINERPPIVLDPTFLSDFPDDKVQGIQKDYILFYYAEHMPQRIKEQIFEYARLHNLAVYGAGECDKRYTDVTVNLTPFQWVSMFKNARFVITGTFHGVAFSIENKKQFKVYVTQKNRIKKVNDLLTRFGIANRSITDDFVFDMEAMSHEIDYDSVFKAIDVETKKSIEYLKQSIRND